MSLLPAVLASTADVMFGELINDIVSKYFMQFRCVVLISETEGDIAQFVPPDIDIFHIRIADESKIIEEIEENHTLDPNAVSRGTKAFERLLVQTLNANCQGYIIQANRPRSVVSSLARATRMSVGRDDRYYVFLSFNTQFNPQYILSMDEMNFMPNLIVATISHSCENYEKGNMKNLGDLIKIKNETTHDNAKHFSETVLSKELSQIEASAHVYGNSMHHTHNIAADETCTEIITHKFAGREGSKVEMLLDVWKWNGEESHFLHGNNLFPDKLLNLQGKQLGIISFEWAQFVIQDLNADPPIQDGLDIRIIKEFSRIFNSTLRLDLDNENYWGQMYENGSGTGLHGNHYL